ncbi:MAG TPA: AtpZ/AtpI family protein [Aurantimonas sp.]|jgi:ATP synthase protein I|nr:AtpZ/AtpI family protein [Aurantimonas sp.]
MTADKPNEPDPTLLPVDDAALSARREALARRIAEQRRRLPENREPPDRSQGMQGVAQGLKIASEFVAGVIVGAAIGYLIDMLAGTSPFGLITFLMIGFAAGVLNVIRGASGSGPVGGGPGEGAGKSD